jgi:hypothetical protein
MGEEAVLADSGWAGDVVARVRQMKRLAILINLQKRSSVALDVQDIEILPCRNRFAAACSNVVHPS